MKLPHIKSLIFSAVLSFAATNFALAQQGTVVINQDKEITTLLEAKKQYNKDSNDYYKIQIYSGDRNNAEAARTNFNNKFTLTSKIVYETPNFKIWAGNFRSRLEADRALKKIKSEFPSAFIFKPKK